MAEVKTVDSSTFKIKVDGTDLTGFTRSTYTKDDNANRVIVRGAATGEAATFDYFIEVSKSDYDSVTSTEDKETKTILSASGNFSSTKYYRKVGEFGSDGKFKENQYTGAGLAKEFANYNSGKANKVSTLTRNSNITITQEENIDIDSDLNQTNLGNRNVSRTGTEEEQSGAAQQKAVDERIAIENIKVGEGKRRTNYGNYYYPNNLRSTQQDRIIFTMKYISGSRISARLGEKPVQRKFGSEQIEGSVTLPIQPAISDSSTVDWSGGRLNAVQAFSAAASLKLISSESGQQFGENVSGIMGKIARELRDNKDYGEAFKIYFAQEAVGVQGLLSRAAGAILNPNLELLFNGPSLRPVNFSFKLSPRDSTEATQIRNIIRFFKQGMSVKTTDSEVFLKSPNVFDIRYITYDNNGVQIDHPSINRVKTCALLSCNVDYTPDGSYMTYNDPSRTMTSYQMNLQFSELDPIYDKDYTALDNDPAGDGAINLIGY